MVARAGVCAAWGWLHALSCITARRMGTGGLMPLSLDHSHGVTWKLLLGWAKRPWLSQSVNVTLVVALVAGGFSPPATSATTSVRAGRLKGQRRCLGGSGICTGTASVRGRAWEWVVVLVRQLCELRVLIRVCSGQRPSRPHAPTIKAAHTWI